MAVSCKLEVLGWGDDIPALPLGPLAKHKLVDRPQRLAEKSKEYPNSFCAPVLTIILPSLT
jgi:hypothetical protein